MDSEEIKEVLNLNRLEQIVITATGYIFQLITIMFAKFYA